MTPTDLNDLLPAHVRDPKSVQKDWSPQQLAIYNEPRESQLLIEAKAGSGKSTTIVEKMNRVGGRSGFLAFNKSIADELRAKVRNGSVSTLNSLGHRILTTKRPGAKLNSWKTHQYLRQKMSKDLYESTGKHVARVVAVAKGCAVGIFDEARLDQFHDITERYVTDLTGDQIEPVAKVARQAFLDLVAIEDEFDFDDQLYMPVAQGWTFPAYDNLFVDEAQDLNPIQHCMLTKMAERGAFITAVGDRRQAIYGFRGALSNSMDLLSQTFSMKELPLSITYRCAQAIVARAQEIVPDIEARPGAPEGLVKNLEDYPDISVYKTGDLILCRNNGPIFGLAVQFLRARLPCQVFSNFLDELEKFIQSFDAKSMPVLISRLEEWFSKHKKDCEERGAWGKLEGIQDKYSVVKTFANEFTDVNRLLAAVRSLVTSQVGPRISTIHRAKGLEADTVYLLRYDLLPSSRATSAEQITQEQNLQYVAITRAKNNLFILPMGEDA